MMEIKCLAKYMTNAWKENKAKFYFKANAIDKKKKKGILKYINHGYTVTRVNHMKINTL